MPSQDQNLSAEQTELVAVAASVGAGCQPCISHHLKAGAQAGLDGEQLLAAVAGAERVGAEAAVAIGDHARAELGASVTSPALLSQLEEALASLGAALGANDAANIERQLRAAADLGASRSQLEQAIDTAHTVQENAARIHLREAERLLDAEATTATTATPGDHHDAGCGCGADDERREGPVAAEEPEPVAAANGDEAARDQTREAPKPAEEPVAATPGHGGCGAMATRFAWSDASGPMAGRREVFERCVSSVSPTETDEAPAATTASGARKKEA